MSSLSRQYLILYNSAQAVGWAAALFVTLHTLAVTGNTAEVYSRAGLLVRVCQGLEVVEIIHAALGLVRGSPVTALTQWAGRSNCLFAVVHCIPQLWNSPAISTLFIAWSLSEVIRYPWYAATLVGRCPGWLTWLRYSAFIPLYPVGALSEVWLIWRGLPYIRSRKLHSIVLPNSWNLGFSYYALCVVLLCVYPIPLYLLQASLMAQRRKKLAMPTNHNKKIE